MIIDNINIISQENKLCDKRDINDDPQYTLAAIEDEIVYSLYGATTLFLHEGNKIFHIRQKYVEQAKIILFRINVFQPIPVFVINLSDLSPSLKRELKQIMRCPEILEEVVTNAVARILEDVNPKYFRVSGVRRNIIWRFDP
ncbi:MAG TPA: hypothetical protein VE130_16080 [Nitrososphaeraceae archaeon]|nr:hypothetical protein [Nitrososphaeraceae archaeon]